jgi:hypothetical protein
LSYNITLTELCKKFICEVNSFSCSYVYGFFKFGFDKTHRSPLQMYMGIDAHGLKIQGRGYLMFFCQNPQGGSRVSGKIAWGGPPISGFIAFLLTSVLKFAWGGYYIYPPPSPPTSPPLCASMYMGKIKNDIDLKFMCPCWPNHWKPFISPKQPMGLLWSF